MSKMEFNSEILVFSKEAENVYKGHQGGCGIRANNLQF